LDIGASAVMRQIPLSNFGQVESLRDRLGGLEWPAQVPTDAVGGVVDHQFTTPGVYTVTFVVSGQITQHGNEESYRVNTTVTVSTKPTLQVMQKRSSSSSASFNFKAHDNK